jgi:hypothetical protein
MVSTLLVAAIAPSQSAPLEAAAAPSVREHPAPAAPLALGQQTVSCTTTTGSDVWRGDALVTVQREGTGFRVTLSQYKLTTPQNGRTSANVDPELGIDGWDGGTSWSKAESGDVMQQDGQWHTPSRTVSTRNDAHAGAQQRTSVRVKFTFDRKTWADPSCTTDAVAEPVPDAADRRLPNSASERERDVQPAFDFDTDGCYPVPAIRSNGTTSPGLDVGIGSDLTGGCRDGADLIDTNAYVRTASNNGWTAHMYGYYFEKDHTGVPFTGHRHDLEHVIVWSKDGEARPRYVSVSAHGRYETRAAADVLWTGNRPEIVYHKDGIQTHAFRFGTTADAGAVENHMQAWQVGGLVSWDGFPPGFRDTLVTADFGNAKLDLRDDRFAEALLAAKPASVPLDPRS